jgi:hypothetical protein
MRDSLTGISTTGADWGDARVYRPLYHNNFPQNVPFGLIPSVILWVITLRELLANVLEHKVIEHKIKFAHGFAHLGPEEIITTTHLQTRNHCFSGLLGQASCYG